MTQHEINRNLNTFRIASGNVFLFCCVVWCAVMTYLSLYQYDDLYYIDLFRSEMSEDGRLVWKDYCTFFSNHYATWNGRFGDKLCPLLLGILPRWGFSALTGGMFGLLIFSCRKIIFRRDHRSQNGYILLCAAMALLMPWLGYIFFGAHAINYIWGSAIGFVVIMLFVTEWKVKLWQTPLLFLLAAVVGSWHEEFTFICAPALLVWLSVFRGRMTTARVIILLGGIAGALFIINSGGFWNRINREHHMLYYMNEEMVIRILKYANISLVTMVAAIVILAVPRIRRCYNRKALASIAMCGTAVLLNVYLSSTLYVEPRYWWFADVFGITGAGLILLPLGKEKCPEWVKKSFTILVVLFTLTHFVVSVVWVHKLCVQREYIQDLYAKSPDGVVCIDRISPSEAPWFALGRGYGMQLRYVMRTHRLQNLCRTDGKELNVLPAVMKNFDPNEVVPVEKCSNISLYKWKNVLISPDTAYFAGREHYETCLHSNGDTLRYRMEFNRFRDKNGQLWVQIEPNPKEIPAGTRVTRIFKVITNN